MKKIFLNKNIIISILAIFLPNFVFASTIYLDTKHENFYVGDVIVVDVILDSEGKKINTVDGNIKLDYKIRSLSISDLSLADSSFSLWPRKPSLSSDNKKISFVGGTPGGVNSENILLFKIAVALREVGQINLSPEDISVYINDGKGTKDTVNIKNLIIDILPQKFDFDSINDLNQILLNDNIPPNPFEIFLGQDNSIFDGKKFISFNAIDRQSGIKYYEVIEEDLDPVRSGNTYVLQNQNEKVKIVVIAHDFAGNTRKSELYPKNYNLLYIIIALFIIIIFVFVISKKTKNDAIQ